MANTITVPFPERLRDALETRGVGETGIAHWSLQAIIIEAYREGLISRGMIGELLGMSFEERETWLSERDVPYPYGVTDLQDDRQTFKDNADR
jgi:hypothetical protein